MDALNVEIDAAERALPQVENEHHEGFGKERQDKNVKFLKKKIESDIAAARALEAAIKNASQHICTPETPPSGGGGGRARWSYASSSIHIGGFLGGTALTSLPTESSSRFYRDGTVSDTPVGFAFGGSIFKDFATFGNKPGPFGSFVLSGGLVVDYSTSTSLNWSGLCGGTACTGTGRMDEFNYIAELKLTTPIASGLTTNGYVGVGGATMWPSGTPTGTGGPSFQGNATAWAFRVGGGIDKKINENWSVGAKVGFQTTGPTDYDTSLVGERFHIARKNEAIFGTTFTYTPSDFRLKRDIAMVGQLENGLGLYRYHYIWSDQVYVGVMAQEVAQVDPDAVVLGDDGYLRVNYARLGLRMQTWDEWKASH